jgi:hypothetical protein
MIGAGHPYDAYALMQTGMITGRLKGKTGSV